MHSLGEVVHGGGEGVDFVGALLENVQGEAQGAAGADPRKGAYGFYCVLESFGGVIVGSYRYSTTTPFFFQLMKPMMQVTM